MSNQPNVTRLLADWRAGDHQALDALAPYIYDELRLLAKGYMGRERASHTLQATALVHEAYVRLVDMDISFKDRSHFLAVTARMMRRMLVDHARKKNRQKRGGSASNLELHESLVLSPESEPEILELDEALEQLSKIDPRSAQVIELLFFGGLTYDEAATALDISRSALFKELQFAKAWLKKTMQK